jgi:hypothetical protein
VELCKDTRYRGGCGKTTDGCCNPFYSTTTDAADCGNLGPGGSCTSDDECAGDLLCVEEVCAEEPLGDIGDACDTDRDCQIDLLCIADICAEEPPAAE